MKMKKFSLLFACLVASVLLVGCQNSNNSTDDKGLAALESVDEGIKITVAKGNGTAVWFNETKSGIEGEVRFPEGTEEISFLYPFTEKGKVYEFLLAGPLDKENNWQSEYVRCAAGGGLGELIDVDAWNKNINIKDSDYKNHSFRISGDVSALFDNSKEQFSCANMWIDIRPGTQENHREKTLTYSSMETCVIGNHHDHDWYRTVDDLKNPIVIQNHPDYGTATIAPDASYNEDVFEVLREWDNEFWVVMSIQEVRLAAYPNMTFHLHWK